MTAGFDETSAAGAPLEHSDPDGAVFEPEVLDRTVIAIPLLRQLQKERDRREPPHPHKVVIDVNLEHPGGREQARSQAMQLVTQAAARAHLPVDGLNSAKSERTDHYLFAELDDHSLQELVRLNEQVPHRAIHHIWPDFPLGRLSAPTASRLNPNVSISTVKADAARRAFDAAGRDIVWAIADSGIDASHPHFREFSNLDGHGVAHQDFTGGGDALRDEFGHGTHVAGIVAGEWKASTAEPISVAVRERDEMGEVRHLQGKTPVMSGVAPECKLVSLKVLDEQGRGETSSLLAALQYVQEVNGYGRRIRIHGVNLSVGYSFDPEWFACGQSPVCVEVDRLVRSGVVVVVAAGNTGYGVTQSQFRGPVAAGLDLSINDPGNAEQAITVGSTHRDAPHIYGVSYFSSKGPTGDGRVKPDLVAPGEKIVSAAAGKRAKAAGGAHYAEDSGTSMAAPHVSGVIAAFLSARREFIGRPEEVKRIFLSTATDLNRDRHFQGRGLVDLMRAIQSV